MTTEQEKEVLRRMEAEITMFVYEHQMRRLTQVIRAQRWINSLKRSTGCK